MQNSIASNLSDLVNSWAKNNCDVKESNYCLTNLYNGYFTGKSVDYCPVQNKSSKEKIYKNRDGSYDINVKFSSEHKGVEYVLVFGMT